MNTLGIITLIWCVYWTYTAPARDRKDKEIAADKYGVAEYIRKPNNEVNEWRL